MGEYTIEQAAYDLINGWGMRLVKKSWVYDVHGTENPVMGTAPRSCLC
jgi:hypothetical protein